MNTTSFLDMQNQLAAECALNISKNTGLSITVIIIIFAIILIWELIWKILAMWKAAKKDSIIWFIVLALVNTVGILPILYIFWFSEIKKNKKVSAKQAKKTKKKRK